ncbi:hypothetical protein N658DRAFT_480163 [Parathielavia hyrcaniae]|uniref:Heterokaryon incompatibility domain-containing protein n=1 Tax=Parathielavia hyrcaniae TaxID=113614 RepID=A0AAN6PS10_9PEZI|nr:hypothetical protein N658DRAFT_480163 [Parathielavia hyrcaniae]
MENQDPSQLAPLTAYVLYNSGILGVVGSALGGVLAPVLDRILGESLRWCLIVLLCFAPGSPPLLPLMKRDISLTTYIVAWHFGLFVQPCVDRIIWKGTDDDFLNKMATLEWKLRAFFLPWLAGRTLSLLWAYRFTTATVVALLLGACALLFPGRHTSSVRLIRVRRDFWMLVVSTTRFWMNGDFSIRTALLRLYNHISMPLDRWEKDVARSRRRRAEEETQQPDAYVYRPLESPRHIRLLKLEPKSWFNPPSCGLVHICLDDLSQGRPNTPGYEAISYTWGTKAPSIPLNVDGKRLLVTDVIDDFLFHRQSSLTPVYLWIDAICINQSSTAEKDVQLPLMREIYQSAQRAVVWLDKGGPANAYEASALVRLIRTAGLFTQTLGFVQEGQLPRIHMLYMSEKEEGAYRAVGRLLGHPWFTRIWILQEIAVSKEIHIMTSGMCLDWFTLAAFVKSGTTSGQLERRIVHFTSPQSPGNGDASGLEVVGADRPLFYRAMVNAKYMSMVRHRVLDGDPLSLATLVMQSYNMFASTDPRDKIFALLGIASDGQALPFKPEYGRSVTDVFIDTHSHVLSSAGDRWSIALAFAGRSYSCINVSTGELVTRSALSTALPSWVPDYSLQSIVGMRTPHPNVTARIDPSSTVTVLNDRHHPRPALLLPAMPLATVTRLTEPFPVARHPIQTINRDAPDLDKEILTFLSNANRGAREWYTAALTLALSTCFSNPEEEESTRQILWELIIDPYLADETASTEEPVSFANMGPSKPLQQCSQGGDGHAPSQEPPLYPFHSIQARRLFDQYLLSPIDYYVRLTGPTATGDKEATTAAVLHFTRLLTQTFPLTVGGRRLAVLRYREDGRRPLMALVPPGAREGDMLVLVRGAWSPFLFRPAGSSSFTSLGDRVAELGGVCTLGGDEDGVMRDAAALGESKWEKWVLI